MVWALAVSWVMGRALEDRSEEDPVSLSLLLQESFQAEGLTAHSTHRALYSHSGLQKSNFLPAA